MRKLLKELEGKTIKIGPHVFTVRLHFDGPLLTPNNTKAAAWFSTLDCEFAFDVNYAMGRRSPHLVESFYHELIHASVWAMRLDLEEKGVGEEVVAECLGRAGIGIFVDNPWILPWMAKGLK